MPNDSTPRVHVTTPCEESHRAYNTLEFELVEWLEKQDRVTQSQYLFLEQSEEFRGCWQVDSLWPEYFIEYEPLIGAYRLVTPLGLDEFLSFSQEHGYHVVFADDPVAIIDGYQRLQKLPSVSLTSTLEGTTKGFLPWQIVGFNKLIKADLKGGYFVWTTGAGKTAMIAAALLQYKGEFDLAMVVVKSHNKIDTQRKLRSLGGIESIVIDGTINKRYDLYEEIEMQLVYGDTSVVAITNYEKFRDDTDVFKTLFKRRRLLLFWDEMPAKLSNPSTKLYKGVKSSLYESFYSKPRPTSMRHWLMSATPIENNPGDIWGCVNIMWPGLLGTQGEFNTTYVVSYDQFGDPQHWKNLDRLEAKIGFMTHRVSKDDPEVAAMFPEVLRMPTVIDWHPRHRTLYDKLTGKAKDLINELEDANILEMIQMMQMVCDAPSMIQTSATNRERFNETVSRQEEGEDVALRGPKGSDIATLLLSAIDVGTLSDAKHTKLEALREIILEKHPDEKVVVHSTWAEYIFPVWSNWLTHWGITHILYHGTPKQKQMALDKFRDDPSIQVFLSGDAGADSIDIAEARVGVNYNIPWKWTTLQQRQGRRDRVTSGFDTIYTYSLIMPDSVDERKLAICERKRGFHEVVFDGRATEEAMSASLTRDELIYLITGQI